MTTATTVQISDEVTFEFSGGRKLVLPILDTHLMLADLRKKCDEEKKTYREFLDAARQFVKAQSGLDLTLGETDATYNQLALLQVKKNAHLESAFASAVPSRDTSGTSKPSE